MTTGTGPSVNYDRIEAALKQHRATLTRIDELSAMRDTTGRNAKCYLMVEGDLGKPLEVSTAVAQGLIENALTASTTTVAALGEVLYDAGRALP